MTLTDWFIDIALVALVLRQIRPRAVDLRYVLVPLVLVGWAAVSYLRTIPTTGNNLVLVGTLMALGAVLGLLSGAFTTVRAGDGVAMARSGVVACALWVLGVGCRLGFQLYATHGGGPAIERFGVQHAITTDTAWTAALILMALAEVVLRLGVIVARAHRVAAGVPVRVPAGV